MTSMSLSSNHVHKNVLSIATHKFQLTWMCHEHCLLKNETHLHTYEYSHPVLPFR